jgi:hypothetical protein
MKLYKEGQQDLRRDYREIQTSVINVTLPLVPEISAEISFQ